MAGRGGGGLDEEQHFMRFDTNNDFEGAFLYLQFCCCCPEHILRTQMANG